MPDETRRLIYSGRIPELSLLVLSAVLGLVLAGHAAWVSSATYDEVTYLRTAAEWWRLGSQDEITRMGSPVTFWKLQQAPTFILMDALGYGDWIDHPIEHQSSSIRAARLGALWIWFAAWLGTATWAGWKFGPRSRVFAAWLFALSPNLLAHGGLVTMEMPLIAASVWLFACFDRFLASGDRRWFWISAALAGLAFSCKFTAFLYPPMLALAWLFCEDVQSSRFQIRRLARIAVWMVGFVGVMVLTNLILTFAARIPLSQAKGEHPFLASKLGAWAGQLAEWSWPQDWVGFLNQLRHQRSGGPSYLLGEVRLTGWWYYYPVSLAVKVPIAFALLLIARMSMRYHDRFPIFIVMTFLAIAMAFSKRNYGLRYLLPVAPAAIVWVAAIISVPRLKWLIGAPALLGYAVALALIHPHELSYFNAFGGGMRGGRRILADSNLDWGQGLRALASRQAARPDLRDLEFFYFGDTEPIRYGVVGVCHVVTANDERNRLPVQFEQTTRYVAISTSLVWGPWGPPGYFESWRNQTPVAETDDGTILIYERKDRTESPGAVEK